MLCALALGSLQGAGPSLPAGFQAVVRHASIDRPTQGGFAPDGSLLIALKRGSVLRLEPDPGDPGNPWTSQASPVLDLSIDVNETGDRGLNGFALAPGFEPFAGSAEGGGDALHPGYGPSNWLYVSYTAGSDELHGPSGPVSRGVVARYPVLEDERGDWEVDLGAGQVLLGAAEPNGSAPTALPSSADVHGVGSLAFGADGTLLVTAGEGASSTVFDTGGLDPAVFDDWTDPETGLLGPIPADLDCGVLRSQQLDSPAGKVLRIDPETGLGLPSNPYFSGDLDAIRARVFALGLRNPFTLHVAPGTGSVDPADGDPGTIWIGDVGSAFFEELDRAAVPGSNFGWPCREGDQLQELYGAAEAPAPNPHGCPSCKQLATAEFIPPAVAWPRTTPSGAIPQGAYFDSNGAPLEGLVGNCVVAGTSYTGDSYPGEWADRLFVADFGEGWIAAVETNAADGALTVHGFASGFPTIVDILRHPTTGHLWWLEYGSFALSGRAVELVHTGAPTPTAILSATPSGGPAPLAVVLDATGSSSPAPGELEFLFDPGDGSGTRSEPSGTFSHVYGAPGAFLATVQVTGAAGASSASGFEVVVSQPVDGLQLVSPAPGAEFTGGETVVLSGQADSNEVALEFVVDLYHNSHVHPSFVQAPGPLASFEVANHGVDGDLLYYRVTLEGDDGQGPPDTDHVFVYLAGQVRDVTGELVFTSSLDGFDLSAGAGPGNSDFEVLRDGVVPVAVQDTPLASFTTKHDDAPGGDHWIGWLFPSEPPADQRLVEVVWTGGPVGPEGGWFSDPRVEARVGGTWVEVTGLSIDPAYPGGPTPPPEPGQTHHLRFDPVAADGIRLRGQPGGTIGYVSATELRVRGVTPNPDPPGLDDLTGLGMPLALALDAGLPLSPANPDPQTFVDGTQPQPGGTSLHASFDSAALAPLAGEDWYGLEFPLPVTASRLELTEGAPHSGGGAFADLRVETRWLPGSPWTPVSGLSLAPPLDTLDGAVGFERVTLTFDPTPAMAVRVVGAPEGGSFAGVAELRVFGPEPPTTDCGAFAYGLDLAAGTVTWSTLVAPHPGESMPVLVQGPGPGAGLFGISLASAEVPLGAGLWMLVDPAASLFVLAAPFDGAGRALLLFDPVPPGLAGSSVFLQGVHIGPFALSLSAGLELRVCP